MQQADCLNSSTKLIFTTNPGLEDLVCAEFTQRLAEHEMSTAEYKVKPQSVAGRILVETSQPFDAMWQVTQTMRSIHHVHRPVAHFQIAKDNPLDSIRDEVMRLDIDEMVDANSFRVSCKRSGTHDFTSVDVAKVAGAALVDHYGCTVNLTDFETNVRVDVDGDLCSVMVQLTTEPLTDRYAYAYRPRVALKANVAFAMMMLASINPDGVPLPTRLQLDDGHNGNRSKRLHLLDPFCGSGTILIEAATCLPDAQIYGNERFDRLYVWTQDNLKALDFDERISVMQGDARDIATLYPAESMDVIVTNPPFGAQLGQETNFYTLYLKFLEAAAQVLKPDGRIVMLVWKRKTFNKVVRRVGLSICHARVVDLGGLFPGIFVLKKVP